MVADAAGAVLLGAGDPITLLDRPSTEWLVTMAITAKAHELDLERRRAEIDAIGASVGNRVAQVIAKAFR